MIVDSQPQNIGIDVDVAIGDVVEGNDRNIRVRDREIQNVKVNELKSEKRKLREKRKALLKKFQEKVTELGKHDGTFNTFNTGQKL